MIIEGWKNRSLKVSKIIKTSLEKVVEDAKKAGKYNDETVSEVKVTRLGMNILSMNKDIEDEMFDTETGEKINIELTDVITDGLTKEKDISDEDLEDISNDESVNGSVAEISDA